MNQYIGFKVNSGEYMVPIVSVREIITLPPVTSLPQLPSYIKGITNLRGSIVPVIHLENLLDSSYTDASDSGNMVIIIAAKKVMFGIIVDSITGVLMIEDERIDRPDDSFRSTRTIKGIARFDNKLILLLDTMKLLPLEDMCLLEDFLAEEKRDTVDGKSIEVPGETETIGGRITTMELLEAKNIICDTYDKDHSRNRIFEMTIAFMEALSNHDLQQVETVLNQMIRETDSGLFNEVGKVTRKLHDSLENFKGSLESGLHKLSSVDVPNAVDKLQFVITKTEEAANKTMGIAETYLERSAELAKHVDGIKDSQEAIDYINVFRNDLHNDMTTIITAQQFQDITGQTIRKVIDLVSDVETELLKLITKFGIHSQGATEKNNTGTAGHDVVEVNNIDRLTQSDVESLLNEFGF